MNSRNTPPQIAEAANQMARILSCSGGSRCHLRILIVAAHPDDETLGACAAMSRSAESTVMFLTDGAPRDPQLRSLGAKIAREEYALLRRKEALTALALMGIQRKRIFFTKGIDQESVCQIPLLLENIVEIIRLVRPDLIITHPYEGGHPDHDAAALLVSAAIEHVRPHGLWPAVFEMTSYHAVEGKCTTNQFLPAAQKGCTATKEYELWLSPEERARKEQMLSCYRTQKIVISSFQVEPERLRPILQYDFARPPHSGRLWYECLGWPLTGKAWRSHAKNALPRRETRRCA